MNESKPNSESEDEWTRRQLLSRGGAFAAALLAGSACSPPGCNGDGDQEQRTSEGGESDEQTDADDASQAPQPDVTEAADPDAPDLSDWSEVRQQFIADPDVVHMAGMLLTAHPKPVRDAIEHHRKRLDENPVGHLHEHWARSESEEALDEDGEEWAMRAAGEYLQMDHANIALTDSTTEGLAMVYNGLDIAEDQEVLTGHWNHWATEGSLDYRAQKTGFDVRRARLYDTLDDVSEQQLVDRLIDEIRPQTRVVAVTWVHSVSGLKLPIGEIGRRIEQINQERDESDRILYCVDGVHGFGVEDAVMEDFHCDFFIAGCHKWLFGPRGTGIIAAAPDAWQHATPTVPSFSMDITQGRRFTPGGFKAYEHYWALHEAFNFHMDIGKDRVEQRIHALTEHLLEGLDEMDHVQVRTPLNPDLRAGIVTFEVDGRGTYEVVNHLREDDIIASTTPEENRIPRLAPGLLNDHVEIERILERIAQLG